MLGIKDHKSITPFPVIMTSTVFNDVDELNADLLNFVKELTSTEENADQVYSGISTEGASQPNIDICKEYYGKKDCITKFVDDIMRPGAERWARSHFYELIGQWGYSGELAYTTWATHYTPGSWQTPHIHRGKIATGVYFVKMPPQKESLTNGANCTSEVQVQPPGMRTEGSFVIQNPHPESGSPIVGGWQTHREFLPQEGELIIIPSWVSHYPKPFTEGERCVIVFDVEYRP